MPEARIKRSNFTSGELAPTLKDRSDLKQHAFGAEKMRNVVVHPHGGFRRRPGLQYEATASCQEAIVYTGMAVPVSDLPYEVGMAAGSTVLDYSALGFGAGHDKTDIAVFFRDSTWVSSYLYTEAAGNITIDNTNHTVTLLNKSLTIGTYAIIVAVKKGFNQIDLKGSGDYGGGAIRIFEFEFSNEQTYLFAFTEYTLNIYREVSGTYTLQATLGHSYSASDLACISVTQKLDSLLIFCETHATYWVKRDGSHTDWLLELWPYAHICQYDFADAISPATDVDHVYHVKFDHTVSTNDWAEGDLFSLIVNGDETEAITYSIVDTTLEARIEAGIESLRTVDAGDITCTTVEYHSTHPIQVSITFSGSTGGQFVEVEEGITHNHDDHSLSVITHIKGQGKLEIAFSLVRGFPSCGAFFQGRLYVAGSYSLPQTVFASRAGNTFDFDNSNTLADNGFLFTANTDEVSSFRSVYAGRHLQFLSSGAEFYVPISDKEPVTPENFVLRRTTQKGAKLGIAPRGIDGSTTFVGARGKSIYQIGYQEASSSYDPLSLTKLAYHLIDDPVDMAFHNTSSSEEADYLYIVNSDGTLAVLTTLAEDNVNAWSLFTTNGSFLSCAVVFTDALFAVSRTVDLSMDEEGASNETRVFIERFKEGLHMDSGVQGTEVASSTSGLAHLSGQTVKINLDNAVQATQDVDASASPSAITFARPSATDWEAGLAFPDVSDDDSGYETLVTLFPFEVEPGGRTLRGEKLSISDVTLALYETSHVEISAGESTLYPAIFRSFGSGLLDVGMPVFTGRKEIEGLQNYSEEGSLSIAQTEALGMTVLGVTMKVSF